MARTSGIAQEKPRPSHIVLLCKENPDKNETSAIISTATIFLFTVFSLIDRAQSASRGDD